MRSPLGSDGVAGEKLVNWPNGSIDDIFKIKRAKPKKIFRLSIDMINNEKKEIKEINDGI